jgi:hypothetical protein
VELRKVLPDSESWAPQSHTPGHTEDGREYWFEISARPPRPQRLVVLLRRDGDLQVEYHIEGRRGSPFEALFIIPDSGEEAAFGEVARLIEGLLTERLVLAYTKGVWRGGRTFLEATQLTEATRRKLAWVTSWSGTYDWPAKQ